MLTLSKSKAANLKNLSKDHLIARSASIEVRQPKEFDEYYYELCTEARIEDILKHALLTSRPNGRFYYAQADFFLNKINIYQPVPIFVIHSKDIPESLAKHIDCLGEEIKKRIVTNVVRRIYESVDPYLFPYFRCLWKNQVADCKGRGTGTTMTSKHPWDGLSGGNEFIDDDDDNDELEDYSSELIKLYNLKTLSDIDQIWRYVPERGIFVPDAEPIVKAKIEEDLGHPYFDPKTGKVMQSPLTRHKINEYLGHIERRTYIGREDFNPSLEWIATENCMINLFTGLTEEFSPEFMCTTQIPVRYDLNREYIRYDTNPSSGEIEDFFRMIDGPCPKIMKFLSEIITPVDAERVLDFMAYILWRSYKFNYWMLCNGAGFNGKSILLMLIERFLGSSNVSGETLDRLLHEKFAVANLFQKMVNVDADVSGDVILNNTGIIKKLTGNDLHAAEFKFKKPFAFRNYSKLIFSCNKIPETEDYTDAFLRRIIIVNFTQQFFGEKEDPNLIDKLCVDEEFSGLLYELLCRLPRVLREGVRPVTSEVIGETYDKYTRGSNPVKYFYEKALEANPGNRVKKLDLYDHYYDFCKAFGLAPESDYSLSRRLKEEFHLEYKRTSVKGEQYDYWKDIGLKDWREAERKEEEENRFEWFSNASKASDEELK